MGLGVLLIWTMREGETAEKKRISFFTNVLERNDFNVVSIAVKPVGKVGQVIGWNISRIANHVIEEIRGRSLDLIIASVPAVSNALIAYEVSRKLGLPMLLDVRDVWEEYAKTRYRHIYGLGVSVIVRRYYRVLRETKLITTPTEYIAKYYRNRLGRENVYVVPNGTWVSVLRCREQYTKEYDLVYLADFNNPYQEYKLFIELLKAENILMAIIGDGKYLSLLKDYAREEKVLDNIRFLGRIPYMELSKHLCRGRIGVIGRPFIDNPAYLYSIPTKTYDYMAAGLPILAYGPKSSALEELINRLGVGRYLGEYSVNKIIDYYKDIVNNYEYYSSNALKASILFDKENIGKKLVNLIRRVL